MRHYNTLGVQKNASDNTIKQAYKKLAKEHHPDLGGSEEKFKQINEAYEVLKNPETRRAYDTPGMNSSHIEMNMDDIFEQMLGHQRSQAQRQYQRRNQDLKISLTIQLDDLVDHSPKEIAVRLLNGAREVVKVHIPATVQSGDTIRLLGLGDNSEKDLTRGNLYVTIHIKNHAVYRKMGLDLHTTINIDCLDAIIGKDEFITTLSGKTLKVRVPPGTQYGDTLSLNNEGLTFKSATGNILAKVLVSIPSDLTEQQINLIREIRS